VIAGASSDVFVAWVGCAHRCSVRGALHLPVLRRASCAGL